jgi:hypothetical protein
MNPTSLWASVLANAGKKRLYGKYLAQTERILAGPFTGLPRHPIVLHRGGPPDGS